MFTKYQFNKQWNNEMKGTVALTPEQQIVLTLTEKHQEPMPDYVIISS